MTDEEIGKLLYKVETRLDDVERAQDLNRSAVLARIDDLKDDAGRDADKILDLLGDIVRQLQDMDRRVKTTVVVAQNTSDNLETVMESQGVRT